MPLSHNALGECVDRGWRHCKTGRRCCHFQNETHKSLLKEILSRIVHAFHRREVLVGMHDLIERRRHSATHTLATLELAIQSDATLRAGEGTCLRFKRGATPLVELGSPEPLGGT